MVSGAGSGITCRGLGPWSHHPHRLASPNCVNWFSFTTTVRCARCSNRTLPTCSRLSKFEQPTCQFQLVSAKGRSSEPSHVSRQSDVSRLLCHVKLTSYVSRPSSPFSRVTSLASRPASVARLTSFLSRHTSKSRLTSAFLRFLFLCGRRSIRGDTRNTLLCTCM